MGEASLRPYKNIELLRADQDFDAGEVLHAGDAVSEATIGYKRETPEGGVSKRLLYYFGNDVSYGTTFSRPSIPLESCKMHS